MDGDRKPTEDDSDDYRTERQHGQLPPRRKLRISLRRSAVVLDLRRKLDVIPDVLHGNVAGAGEERAASLELKAGREQEILSPPVGLPLPSLLHDRCARAKEFAIVVEPSSEHRPGPDERLVGHLHGSTDGGVRAGELGRRTIGRRAPGVTPFEAGHEKPGFAVGELRDDLLYCRIAGYGDPGPRVLSSFARRDQSQE